MKLFDAVACLKAGPTEFSNALDQSRQACSHQWIFPLILEDQRIQKPVLPWCWRMHIDQQPSELGVFPAAFEGGLDVLLPTVAAQ
jgi:hypothetical protein